MNDRRLIEQLKAQRRDALDRAIERYTPYVSVIVYHAMEGAPREDIEEVTADVFIALWRTAGSITGENLAGYLAAIARNQAKSWLRARRPPEEDLEDVVLPGPDTAAGPVFQREQRPADRPAAGHARRHGAHPAVPGQAQTETVF